MKSHPLVVITSIIRQRPAVAVEDEPALLPGFDFSTHFDQEAPAGLLSDGQVKTSLGMVTCGLDVTPQVKVVLPYGQVTCQRPCLETWRRKIRSIWNTQVTHR